jgi:hypothetical protein
MTDQPKPIYRYHRDLPAPTTADHPNAMACPQCGVPVWQSAPKCHECGVELDGVNKKV